MWLATIKHLRDYLSLQPEFADILVQGGSNGTAPEKFPALFIMRSLERDYDAKKGYLTSIQLWIECWVKISANDPMEKYQQLHDIEQCFLSVLPRWYNKAQVDLGFASKLTIPHFVCDEGQRNLCGSQATLILNTR